MAMPNSRIGLHSDKATWSRPCIFIAELLERFCQSIPKFSASVIGGVAKFLDSFYAAIARLSRYSSGLREPSETLILFATYQRMYESNVSMNCSTVGVNPWD